MSVPVVEPSLEDRLAAWQRTGALDALWPGLTYEVRRRALERIRAATTQVLAGARGPVSLPDDDDPRALGISAFIAGMGALLGHWIAEGRVETTPAAARILGQHLEHGRTRSTKLLAEAARVSGEMRAAGARPILLKGLHTGSAFLPSPATRPAADIDLLVHPAERTQATAALLSLGFAEVRHTRFAARSEWAPRGASSTPLSLELDHADNPWCVDLILTLDRWYPGGLRRGLGSGAFGSKSTVPLAGGEVRVLDQPYLAAFLALHASYDLGRMQMIRLVELVLVMRDDMANGRLEWRELASLIDAEDAWRFVYPALALADELAPGTIDPALLARAERATTSRLRGVVADVRRAAFGPLPRRTPRLKFAWARGWKETCATLADLLVPVDDATGGLRRVYAKRLAILEHWWRRSSRTARKP